MFISCVHRLDPVKLEDLHKTYLVGGSLSGIVIPNSITGALQGNMSVPMHIVLFNHDSHLPRPRLQ